MSTPVATPLSLAVVATAPEVDGPLGDLFRLTRALYLGTGVATSSWFLVDGAGRAAWHSFTDRSTVLSELDGGRGARLAARLGGARAAATARGAILRSRLSVVPDGGVDVALLDEGITGGILDRLAPRRTVVRWTGRDTGTAQRVDRADLVLLAPDATRLDEAPAGPRHELAVGPVGDDARVAAHPVHREVVRERLQIADGVPLALGTGDDVDAVVGAVGAHDDHRVVLGWIDDPANFTVTEGLVAHQPPDIEHVFAADDLAVLCAADVLVARDLDRVDPGLRALAGLGGVVLVGTDGLDDVLADPTNIEQSARSERIRAARLTLDATAAAVRFRELIDSTPVATPGASS